MRAQAALQESGSTTTSSPQAERSDETRWRDGSLRDGAFSRRSLGALHDASVERIGCLIRHWTWTDEAMARFERELAIGWDYEEDLLADHPFGSYYQWCALLCGLIEATLQCGLLPTSQLDALRSDFEATLPGLRACRHLLLVIPTSLEQHPRIVDLLRDEEMLSRLRRVHLQLGEALVVAQRSRELDLLDPEG